MSRYVTRYNGGFLDPLFHGFFDEDLNMENFGNLSMKTDVKEEGNDYLLEIEMPGFEKNNISLSLKDGYLTVEGKVDRSYKEKGDKKGSFVHRERFSGSASRSYYVGEVEEKDIRASYKDGVLHIAFPKESPKKVEEAHRIAIE